MSKMKAHPKSYAAANEALAGRYSIKLGHNTWLERWQDSQKIEPEEIWVRFHNTAVVRFHQDGSTTLHTGGYYTVTTKDRINEFITGRVYQKDHVWYYVGHTSEGALDWNNPQEFVEGMTV